MGGPVQILEMRLLNWGPFLDEHSIPLSVDASAPVIIFRGENMRGKTSLLRAIVWCLYGQIREQDGRTILPVEKMVNLDALRQGDTEFGISLRIAHNGAEYVLHRSDIAVQSPAGKLTLTKPTVTMIPIGGLPYPAATIADVVDGILSRDISDFFLFDGEMLHRFEERLRQERATSQSFVRMQVERALGLPFMSTLASDLETIEDAVTTSMEQVLRRARKHDGLTEKFRAKKDELEAMDKDLARLREREDSLTAEIAELDADLAKVDEIKDLYYERKSLEKEIAAAEDVIADYRDAIANAAEATWWLPAAEILLGDLKAAEADIVHAEDADRARFKLQFQIDQIESQFSQGRCPTCNQPITTHGVDELKVELESLRQTLALVPDLNVDAVRQRRDRLRRYGNAASLLERVHEQEQDLSRERLRNDKRQQRIRAISEQISNNTIDIESLERNLIDRKTFKERVSSTIRGVEVERAKLKQEVSTLSAQIANQPEVDEGERRLQQTAIEARTIVQQSFDGFRATMRQRVSESTSHLFRQLTTEKDYSGVRISEDYMLSVVDHEHRALNMISAGANQILTMAFIGALAECSVDEAPMVMDTPFGRLDRGHRDAILEWVSTFNTQVILFVQSGEYDPQRNAHLLRGKIGREFTIERLSPTRSEVTAA